MKPVIVGISGGSGAGKTTVARRILQHFGSSNAILIGQDSYYRDHSHLPFAKRQDGNFDVPAAVELDMLAKHLGLLKHGTPVLKPVYEYRTHSRVGSETVRPHDVMIIEGLFVLHSAQVRRALDVKIFVDADRSTRTERRLKRDTTERGFTEAEVRQRLERDVIPMHEQYVEPSRTSADFVIDGTRSLDDQLTGLIRAIEDMRRKRCRSS